MIKLSAALIAAVAIIASPSYARADTIFGFTTAGAGDTVELIINGSTIVTASASGYYFICGFRPDNNFQ